MLPKVDYCSSVWNPYTPGLQKDLERIQKRAAAVVSGKRVDNYVQACSELDWSPLHERLKCNRINILYRIIHDLIVIDFNNYFAVRFTRPLRVNNNVQFVYKHTNTVMCQNSFFYRVLSEWNNLPQKVVSTGTFSSFKERLRCFF